jgi:hypothetical protein
MSSKPVIGPCGGQGQPACPPTPAIQINEYPVVVQTSDGQKHVVQEVEDDGDEQ